MKLTLKILLTSVFVLILVSSASFARPTSYSVFIGAALPTLLAAGHSESMQMQLGLGGEVNIPVTDMIDVQPGLMYYLPSAGVDTPADQKLGVSPLYINGKIHFGEANAQMDPYAGAGLNYSSWVTENMGGETPTGSIGYQAFFGVNMQNFLGEIGYIIMNGVEEGTVVTSSGLYVKAGYTF